MKKIILLLTFLLSATTLLEAQKLCGITNDVFKDGEELKFTVYYNASFIYIGAGEATFTTHLEDHKGTPTWHVVGKGKTFSSYDWFFKVRDQYESYIDTTTMLPLHFVRNVSEGNYKKYEEATFDRNDKKARSEKDTIDIPNCMQDVISAIYNTRNIDFDQYKKGDKINLDLYLSDKVYPIYVRYMGKEKIKTKFGKFNSIVLKPLLIKGTIFEGGEKMTVWVSDDKNRIPLRVNSPITIGNVKVDMMGYKNLRYPLTSQIN